MGWEAAGGVFNSVPRNLAKPPAARLINLARSPVTTYWSYLYFDFISFHNIFYEI